MKEQVVELASKLADLSPRRADSEREAAQLIKQNIDQDFIEQSYEVVYPDFQEWFLKVDGQKINCLPGGLRSGRIEEKNVVNSIHNGQEDVKYPAISFNPYAEGLSAATFYSSPVLAVDPADIDKVLNADKIEGELKVEWKSEESSNIIVGNKEDPEKIVMTHYDSLWGGFIDNGFSVSLLVNILDEIDLDKNLVVFAGSEEISHESPYHCYGYRRFEARYSDALQKADQICVVDSLGRGEQKVIESREIVEKAIVFSQSRFMEKTKLLASKYHDVLDIYHSPLDKPEALTDYQSAVELVRSQIVRSNSSDD